MRNLDWLALFDGDAPQSLISTDDYSFDNFIMPCELNTLLYRIIVTSHLFFFDKKFHPLHPLFDLSHLLILAIHLSIRQIIFDYVY